MIDEEPRRAGVGSQGRLQHSITVQREQAEHQRLSDLIEGLPQAHPARSSWLKVGEFAQTLITSWPSENTGVDLGFDDCLCHYLGGLLRPIPSEVGKAGLGIKLAARARRAAADGAPAPPRERICDGYGCSWRRRACPATTLTSAPAPSVTSWPATCRVRRRSETRGLFAHVLPQAVLDRPREGMVPDITAPTRAGQPAPAAGAPPPPRRNVMMDVKTLSGAAWLYREGTHARSNRRGAPVAERARKVHVDYVGRALALDHAHSRQADGAPTAYPGVREQVQRHLVGPVLAALQGWDPVVGLVVGSYQGCSEGLHALAREVAEERARTEWRHQMGARSEHEALGIFVHGVHRRWGSVFRRSWARVIRGRLRHREAERYPPPRSARRPRTHAGKRPCWIP